jgi:hypothetical protein
LAGQRHPNNSCSDYFTPPDQTTSHFASLIFCLTMPIAAHIVIEPND